MMKGKDSKAEKKTVDIKPKEDTSAKKSSKPYLPHLLSLAGLFLILFVYFIPVYQGKAIKQGDVMTYKGASKEIFDYREKTHSEPLWTNSMFGGMPAFQISMAYPGNIIKEINKLFNFLVPHPVTFILLCMLGFYFLLITLQIDPFLSFMGAFAFSFSSYFFIILEAGHNTKGYAIAYMAPVIAGLLLTFRGRYLLGGIITATALALEISTNHYQITYYLAMMVLLLFVFESVTAYRKGTFNHILKSLPVLVVALLLALGTNFSNLWTTLEYSKETTRGKTELSLNKENQTDGLDRDYITSWSYGVAESFTFLIPDFKGGASGAMGSNASAIKKADSRFQQYIANIDQYWGAQPFTSGPVYAGSIICFLFILGLLIVKGPVKWWLLSVSILSFALAWGKNFMPLTNFFLDYFPQYDKFRTVSMILVLAEFTFPLLALLTLKEIITNPNLISEKKKQFFIAFGLTGGVAILCYALPSMFNDFFKPGEYDEVVGQLKQSKLESADINTFMTGIEEARKYIFTTDALRTFAFILIAAALIWVYGMKKMQAKWLSIALFILVFIDLWSVNKRYLNNDNFIAKSAMEVPYQPSNADLDILKDKDPNYRVLNAAGNPFSDAKTSYWHKSIGGYHGAKLKRYQELIENQISKNNMDVLNMLNTRYFIMSPGKDMEPIAQRNPNALGNAWFVKNYNFVANADSELSALSHFEPAKTAIVDKRFASMFDGFQSAADSTATIQLQSYAPNHLVYQSKSKAEQLAVFSEIYYSQGWNAYVDGHLMPYFRANYVLRGMRVPAGSHQIEYKFEPQAYFIGEKISLVSSALIILLFVGIGYREFKSGTFKA